MHHINTPQLPSTRHNVQGVSQLQPQPLPRRTPQVGIKVGPQHGPSSRPLPLLTPLPQHHVTNIQPQQIIPYIPPHQRDTSRLNHNTHQKFHSQMHQIQNKNRSHVNFGGVVPATGIPLNSQSQHQQQQQQVHTQLQNMITTILQKQPVIQQQKSNTILTKSNSHPPQSNSHQNHVNNQQKLSKHTPTQSIQSSHPLSSSTLPSNLPPQSKHQQHHHPRQLQTSSAQMTSSSHQETTVVLQQHNFQQLQPAVVSQQKSNVQLQQSQKNNPSVVLQTINSHQQENITVLQKNVTILQNPVHSRNAQQQDLNHHNSHSSKHPKSQNQNMKSNNKISSPATKQFKYQQQQRQKQQEKLTVQSNHSIPSQTSQITTLKISTNTENNHVSSKANLMSTEQKNQQYLREKTNKNPKLACDDVQLRLSSIITNEKLANTKEKTPMCLINELARFNKIQPQYRLTGEEGPAHSKRFTVTLELGDEEYTSEGRSIKKAQHSAAADAICKTKYPHPPIKKLRLKNGRSNTGDITPTVELNALAMKLGRPTVYLFDSPPPSLSLPASTQIQSSSSQLHHNQQKQQKHQHHHLGNEINGVCMPITTTTTTTTILSTNPARLPVQSGTNGNGSITTANSAIISNNNASNLVNNYYHSYERNNTSSTFQLYEQYHEGRGDSQTRRLYSSGGEFPKFIPNTTEICKIALMVGEQKFVGVGETPQAARHDAAARALEVLKPLSSPNESDDINITNMDDLNAALKSPISLVHEIALKRNLLVSFEIKSENGPPHMKIFVTVCTVGNIMTEGEGNGKKISKKRAAEKMLNELKKLPPLSPNNNSANEVKVNDLRRKPQIIKKKTKNIIKNNTDVEQQNHEDINPISRLIQIQQALKEREPLYTLVDEKGAPRRREFVIEVSAGGFVARGTGPNKKLAKRIAAKNLLISMGYGSETLNKENNLKIANGIEILNKPSQTTIQSSSIQPSTATTTTTLKNSSNKGGISGCQIVPGLLLIQQQLKTTNLASNQPKQVVDGSRSEPPYVVGENTTTEINEEEQSPNNIQINNNNNNNGSINNNDNSSSKSHYNGVRPKDQLLYLAGLLDFQVVFSDYPKGNHGEFLTIVTLSTDPPQICHGAGDNADDSQNNAAMTALKMLSSLGLDNVKPRTCNNVGMDGKHFS